MLDRANFVVEIRQCFGKNRKAELLKSVFILAAMVSAYTMQFSDVCEASSKASTHKVTKKSDKKEITKTKAGATKSSKKSSKSNRKMNTDLKGFIEDFSSTVLTTQKSHLAENDLKEALKNIAKNYVDIAGLCPFLFGSNYKKVDKKTRKELIEGGIIASMVAQHLLKLLPHKKSVSTSVKSTKNIRGKSWSVKTVYKVNRESTEQTYNVIFR